MADLGIIFLRRRYPIHWYQSSYIFITGSMPFRYFWATLYSIQWKIWAWLHNGTGGYRKFGLKRCARLQRKKSWNGVARSTLVADLSRETSRGAESAPSPFRVNALLYKVPNLQYNFAWYELTWTSHTARDSFHLSQHTQRVHRDKHTWCTTGRNMLRCSRWRTGVTPGLL